MNIRRTAILFYGIKPRQGFKPCRGFACFICVCLLAVVSSGCSAGYRKYTHDFLNSFDTLTTVTGYSHSEQDFMLFAKNVENELLRMHRLFDIYNDYDGINNLKTVNDNAGIAPVQVDVQLIELAELGVEWYERTGGVLNIAMGPVLEVWHDCRTAALEEPSYAALPDDALLLSKAALCDITKLVIDRENRTLYLTEPGMSLNVGALAKGYAVEWAANNMADQQTPSFFISAGGNVTLRGVPLDGRDAWAVGIMNPDGPGNIDTLYLTGGSAVTSGDYQRYFTVDGKRYGHIIDPFTLHPAERHRAVTVTGPDGAIADILSTVLFIMDEQSGRELIEFMDYQAYLTE